MFMPGLKGGKMSSSDPLTYIALDEDSKAAKKKVNKYAFSGGQATVEEHRKKGGNPDVDVAFQMLKYGLETDDKKLTKIYNDYKSGALLSGELKAITIEKLTKFLEQHKKNREKAKKQIDKFL
jgi:tryptophanyl-tRNA synthetase